MLTRLEVDKVNCHIYMVVKGSLLTVRCWDTAVTGCTRCGCKDVCLQTNDRETPCEGLTLHYIGPMEERLRYSINLPGSVAYSGLVNCYPWGVCGEFRRCFLAGSIRWSRSKSPGTSGI